MKNLSNVNNAPLSGDAQAKEDNEKVNRKPVNKKQLDNTKCGFDNPCVFGKHNPNYNKRYLRDI